METQNLSLNKNRCCIYSRCSTNDQKQNVENQLFQLRQYCQAKNYSIVKELYEYVSGYKEEEQKEREQLNDMLRLAKQRQFDILLVYNTDRLTRMGATETLNLILKILFKDCGVMFESFTEPYLNTTGDMNMVELLLAIKGWANKQDSLKTSLRVKHTLERKKDEGEKIGRQNLMTDGEKERLNQKIIELKDLPVREICKQVTYRTKKGLVRNISIGYVHKTLKIYNKEKA
ncbi:MAG: recombinase family protein [Candidatus Pacearchaeota archaeon]|jgi:DNA invertase Pin-like site-specific DNA recombinase